MQSSSQKQKLHAEADLLERHLQVRELTESNTELEQLLLNTQRVQLIDAALTLQEQGGLVEVMDHMPAVEETVSVLGANVK